MTALAVSTQRMAVAQPTGELKTYQRSLLIEGTQRPLRASDLVVGENYIFHYPYVTTPCFLVNLGVSTSPQVELQTEAGRSYNWQGGVGPDTSIVAFSAICAHKMTHPAKSVSFINYRHERVRFHDKQRQESEGSQLIYCCSEKSVYDARNGARVLGGPAKQPLAAIQLAYDESKDYLYAVGTYGGEMFDKFFTKFTARLQLEYSTSEVDRQVGAQTEVTPLDQYCKNQILC
jgi:Rieske Fe-S protein